MKKLLPLLIILCLIPGRCYAQELTAPAVPYSAQEYMPDHTESFSEALWRLLQEAVALAEPALADAWGVCLGVTALTLMVCMAAQFPGNTNRVVEFTGVVCVSVMLLEPVNTLIRLGTDTVQQLSDYGKLLLPVMTAAMAAHGGVSASAALYVGTAFFDAVLSSLAANLLVPLVYVFLCLSIASNATGESMLDKLRDFVKWLMTWGLKLLLYVFTGYMGITGVISGTVDAAAVKATKLTISGMVPVVGGILSDASETVLVGAGIVKNSVGVYGLLAVMSVYISPFVRIGVQYLLLKLTAAMCAVYSPKCISGTIASFSGAMGFVLAITGSMCLLLIVSTVCMMKGLGG